MGINLQLPLKSDILKPTITVVGVGGAGGNAVNNMISSRLEGVNFVVANTDAQALDHSLCERSIQLGAGITRGLGAGANPDMGRAAAEEAADEIAAAIEGSNMVFITAGMGGGTGTGAAPVVARIAREQNVLTVAIITKPFQFEGTHRMRLADSGLKELQEYVDTLIIIPNQNLFRIANERTTFADAFKMADEVLHSGVRGVTDLMVKPGLINLDFADIRTVMREMGKAMMGTGEATGDRRAVEAAEAAISNPLLDDVSLKGARAALINITGGPDMTLFEVDEAANRIREEVDPEANIIFGSAFNDSMEGRMRVSVVATGIEQAAVRERAQVSPIEQKKPYLFANRMFEPAKPAPRAGGYEPLKPAASAQGPASAAAPATAQGQEAEQKSSAPFRSVAEVKQGTGIEQRDEAAPAAPAYRPDYSATAIRSDYSATAASMAGAAPEARAAEPADYQQADEPAPLSARASAPASSYRPLQSEADDAPVRSIFQRISEVRRSLAASRPQDGNAARAEAAQPERMPAPVERARTEVVKKTAPLTEEDQFLDIPAFLRRQAN